MVPALGECFDGVKEIVLGLLVPIDDCLPRILRKLCVLNNELVQVVTQEVSACIATMPVEDAKEAALGPIFNILLGRRLHDIEDDADAILVIVSYNALVGVGGVTHDEAVLTHTALRWLPARQVERPGIWRGTVA